VNNLNTDFSSQNKSLIIYDSLKISSFKERIDFSLKKIFGEKKIKKILLINPPDANKSTFDFDSAKRKRNSDYPPYGLLIVGRHLLNNGYEVEILNLHHEVSKKCVETKNNIEFNFENFWKQTLWKKIKEFNPDLLSISCLFSVTHNSYKDVCIELKNKKSLEENNLEKMPLVSGGVHISHDPENILKEITSIDIALLNEAELSFVNLLNYQNKKTNIESLSMTYIRESNSEFIKIDVDGRPKHLDLEIIPAYELIKVEEYSKYGTIGSWSAFRKNVKIGTVLSNRGCRAQCTFCNVRIFNGVGVRQRSLKSVEEELYLLKNKYGIDHISWLDDDLLKDEKRAIELFNMMVKKNLQNSWDATNGLIAHSITKDGVVEAMGESGCIGCYIGIESGNRDILTKIKKPGTIETFIKAADKLNQFKKINSRGFLIIGFPEENISKIFDTINLAERMDLAWFNLTILQPWKKTPIFDLMTESNLVGKREGQLNFEIERENSLMDDLKSGEFNVNNSDPTYHIGEFSLQRKIEKIGKILKPFKKITEFKMSDVPKPDELDDIWFYINYRLNFYQMFREKNKERLNQHLIFMEYVHKKTAPDNAIVMYFYAYLQSKILNYIDQELLKKLKLQLDNSEYWSERFEVFGLSFQDLVENKFPTRNEFLEIKQV
jgi:radical SAM superfamily enzyme YgiQ (UPF0313 family)